MSTDESVKRSCHMYGTPKIVSMDTIRGSKFVDRHTYIDYRHTNSGRKTKPKKIKITPEEQVILLNAWRNAKQIEEAEAIMLKIRDRRRWE